ncbi:MAG: Selenide, water dikinase [Deltaproteobacteria bacterium ADurb.Bin022]|jgi:selenide,water dikinase|nr:MAG: Selenide, water dikinase [Deltaproteobacteria bacterium ADurb.Bin022]
MRDLPLVHDPNLLSGFEHAEDAGVYKISSNLALVQTVDFFTPTVDDPFVFGQIAAVNALNDIYAMGAKPLTAMNIVCFPIKTMDKSILRDVLRGGLDKMREAGVLLVGGHSVEDNEIKYGLSVTGVVHPDKVLYNRGAKAGDKLILTKPLGTGIIGTAIKAQEASAEQIRKAVSMMTSLNKKASEMMVAASDIHACTDITGFGLLGHACEMIEGDTVGLRINSSALPVFDGVRDLMETGFVPGGLYRNRDFRIDQIVKEKSCPDWLFDLLFDPQTAGGLFFSLPADKAQNLVETMRASGITGAAVIGEVVKDHPGKIFVC